MIRAILVALFLFLLACGDVGAVGFSGGTLPHNHNCGIQEDYSINGSPITLTAGGAIITETLSLGTLKDGDRLEVWANVLATKGATGGRTRLRINKDSGSGTVIWMGNLDQTAGVFEDEEIPAGASRYLNLSAHGFVSGPGSFAVKITGYSDGSDSTVAPNDGQLVVRCRELVGPP
jgi:hypothetical protein